MAIRAARPIRPWRDVVRAIAAFASTCAVGVLVLVLILKAASPGYWWDHVTAPFVARIVGMFAGMLTLWFIVSALLAGVLARSSRPSATLAAWLGIAVASVLGGSFLLAVPILGTFVAPLVAGFLAGWASWPREGRRDTLVPD